MCVGIIIARVTIESCPQGYFVRGFILAPEAFLFGLTLGSEGL